MPQGEYLGMTLTILDLDNENLAYFQHCADHEFHLQQCVNPECGLIRYPPGTACPWCSGREFNWAPVDARGTSSIRMAKSTTRSSPPSASARRT